MIDSLLSSSFQTKAMHPIVSRFPLWISPMRITLFGGLIGLAIPVFLFFGHSYGALLALVISGICDMLDGATARLRNGQGKPIGAVWDIVIDRSVEFAIILGVVLVAPTQRGFWGVWMLGSILICVTSFLVVGIFVPNRGKKSFHYSPGLMERAEAFLFFAAMIVFPSAFISLACVFSALVFLTAFIRVYEFTRLMQREEDQLHNEKEKSDRFGSSFSSHPNRPVKVLDRDSKTPFS